jgi:phosphatidylinositol-3-phosphatase
VTAERPHDCRQCGSPLADDQRYCLVCGAHAGARGPALERLQRGAAERWPEPRAAAVAHAVKPIAAPAAPASRAPWIPVLRPPSTRVSAALVAAFLGFGVLLGAVAGNPVDSTLAAGSGSPLKLVLPAAGAPASARSTPEAAASGAAGEPPVSEAEATPAPAPASGSTTATPTKTATGTGETGSGGSGGSGREPAQPPSGAPATKLPPIKHVFVIALANEPYASVFGPSSGAHYLAGTLEKRGELLVRYDAVAHEQLANGIALLSGQGPTTETAANCPSYTDLAPTTPGAATSGPSEQALGSGCVYPNTVQTLAGQLTAKHLTLRAYVQGIDETSSQQPACAHPQLGSSDPTAAPGSGPYATFRNPLVYFHSVIDHSACAAGDVGLSRLSSDLAASARTPSFAYVVPDRCHDGNPIPCSPGAPAGMGPADSFLARVVPQIIASKAYREAGLLVITVDEAPSSGEFADSSSCCGQPQFPNLAAPASGLSPRGGGTVGALLLSPWVKGATTSQEPYNHFSILRTSEDLLGVGHLGYAGLPAVKPLAPALFMAAKQR